MLERGYADCPDMTQLSKKLARLYGADLTVDARPMGCNHNLCVSVTGIKDVFALEQESLTQEYTDLALGVAFRPYLVEGSFDPEAVAIEKQMLKKALEDELNDKQLYCQRQASRAFFGDSPAGVRQEGYLEEVDGITGADLCPLTSRCSLLHRSNWWCWAVPRSSARRCRRLCWTSCPGPACAQPLEPSIAMPPEQTPRQLTQCFDTVQAKLCMLFTLGRPMQPQELAAMRLAIALYGGSATSRLFLRVREAQHLC